MGRRKRTMSSNADKGPPKKLKIVPDESEPTHYSESPVIAIRVGADDNAKVFNVHKDLLTTRSLFFQNALKEGSKWTESEGVLELRADSPKSFSHYVQLLYSDKAPIHTTKSYVPARAEIAKNDFETLSHLYVLCEKLQDCVSKNLVVSAWLDVSNASDSYPGHEPINLIYENTPISSPMRKLIVYWIAIRAQTSSMESCRDELLPDFLSDLAITLMRNRHSNVYRVDDASKYHEKLSSDYENCSI